jgi:hypothetical protein
MQEFSARWSRVVDVSILLVNVIDTLDLLKLATKLIAGYLPEFTDSSQPV